MIRKAVIPAAGLGTRFLPATKAMPKEMIPIVDKPTIQYIIEEAVASGIEDILIVTGKGKRAIEDHFDRSVELEELLMDKGKHEQLQEMTALSHLANIHYIRQRQPLGLGHAVWCARRFIGDEPFAVLLGDDIVHSKVPCLRQLIDSYATTGKSTIGVQHVPDEEVSRYGIIDPEFVSPGLFKVRSLVEKPSQAVAPSNLAIIGRYILSPEIFGQLEKGKVGAGGEIQLTDALSYLNDRQGVMALEFSGRRYDVGDKFGFIQATLEIALENDHLRDDVLRLMESLIKTPILA